MKVLSRYLSIGSLSLAAVLTLFLLQALEGQWTWMVQVRDGLARHVPQLSAEMLPIPVAFMLWVRLTERRGGPFALSFSPLAGGISITALIAAYGLALYPDLRQYVFAVGVVAGLFILVPFQECMKRAIGEPRPAIVALIAATAACSYYWLMRTIWEYVCGWTTSVVSFILTGLGFSVITTVLPTKSNFRIDSPYFNIMINPGCNGLEGIFLFTFMLSVMLLIDWDLFKRWSMLLLYEFGIVYMFLFNALRIIVFFAIGYWAYNPHAWSWLHALQGAPVYLFHSYVGWVFYLLAFGLFAAWMYGQRSNGK